MRFRSIFSIGAAIILVVNASPDCPNNSCRCQRSIDSLTQNVEFDIPFPEPEGGHVGCCDGNGCNPANKAKCKWNYENDITAELLPGGTPTTKYFYDGPGPDDAKNGAGTSYDMPNTSPVELGCGNNALHTITFKNDTQVVGTGSLKWICGLCPAATK